jgi:hypothetical protein
MLLQAVKDLNGIVARKKGDVFEYKPWHYLWKGMTEQERRVKGIYVNCYGHSEFQVLESGIDVAILKDSKDTTFSY